MSDLSNRLLELTAEFDGWDKTLDGVADQMGAIVAGLKTQRNQLETLAREQTAFNELAATVVTERKSIFDEIGKFRLEFDNVKIEMQSLTSSVNTEVESFSRSVQSGQATLKSTADALNGTVAGKAQEVKDVYGSIDRHVTVIGQNAQLVADAAKTSARDAQEQVARVDQVVRDAEKRLKRLLEAGELLPELRAMRAEMQTQHRLLMAVIAAGGVILVLGFLGVLHG